MQKIIDIIWEQNQNLAHLLNANQNLVIEHINKFENIGLSYVDKDYYIYQGKGGLKIHETPKGVKKRIAQIAHKYDLSVVVTDGVFYDGDKIEVKSDGTIEDINIVKNSNNLIMGGEILAPYAIVSVFKDDVMITKKLFIVPNDEYKTIKAMGSGNKFSTMMAYKMVYKRVLNGIYALLGVTLDRVDAKEIDRMGEDMRVDDVVDEKKVQEIDTIKQMEEIKNNLDVLDQDCLKVAQKQLRELYSIELDSDKQTKIGVYGKEIADIVKQLEKDNNETNQSK